MEIRKKISGKGWSILTDIEFCLLKTTPDFWLPEKNLAVYLDGPVHLHKQERDEALRDLLKKRHGVRVLSIPYEANTQQERERVFGVIMEALKS
jgi:very-short-patch-repair endonuclease